MKPPFLYISLAIALIASFVVASSSLYAQCPTCPLGTTVGPAPVPPAFPQPWLPSFWTRDGAGAQGPNIAISLNGTGSSTQWGIPTNGTTLASTLLQYGPRYDAILNAVEVSDLIITNLSGSFLPEGNITEGAIRFGTAPSGGLGAIPTDVERLTILNNGHTGVNQSAPQSLVQVTAGDVIFDGPATIGTTSYSAVDDSRFMWLSEKGAISGGNRGSFVWNLTQVGENSLAFGYGSVAKGNYSISLGRNTEALSSNAIAFGEGSSAQGTWSLAAGSFTTAKGSKSVSLGSSSTTDISHEGSILIGDNLNSPAPYSLTVGRYNEYALYPGTISWSADDPVFIVGNGTASQSSNAFVIMKDGKTGVGVNVPTNTFEVEGEVVIGDGYAGSSLTAPTNGLIVEGKTGIGTSSPINNLDVSGAMVVGAGLSGVEVAPTNGFLVEGKTGLGETFPQNLLDVAGGIVVGSGYAGVETAPVDGLLVEGSTGIGESDPQNLLDVAGGMVVGDGYAGVETAPTDGLLVEGSVGIGTPNPLAQLHLQADPTQTTLGAGDGSVVFEGHFENATSVVPVSGAGARLMWVPLKNVFRVGQVPSGFSTWWDDANCGSGSIGMGSTVLASGSSSIAIGALSQSTAQSSIVIGYGSLSSGEYSYSLGTGVQTGTKYATVMGSFNSPITGSASSWVSTDPQFIIGNGQSGTQLSNALVLLKNGNLGLGTNTPENLLDVNGGVVIGTSYAGTETAPTNGLLVEGDVGIGTASPSQALHLKNGNAFVEDGNLQVEDGNLQVQNGSVLFNGFIGSTPTSGSGNRFMWIPTKSALRAGYVSGTEWDDANIGSYSTAFGNDTKASGANSLATGAGTIASGSSSVAIGGLTQATGASSAAFNSSTQATGAASSAFNSSTTASGSNAVAFNKSTVASGQDAATFGENTTASGYKSVAMGFETNAGSYASLVIGQYNSTVGASASSWTTSDPIFVVGNGTSSTALSDAFTVMKDGKVGIQKVATAQALEVNGSGIANSWPTYSDGRLKKDVATIDNALSKVLSLRGVSYKMRIEDFPTRNFSKERQLGVIAQEVEGIVPEAIVMDGEGYKGVTYSMLIPLLIESTKEQQGIIEAIEKRDSESRVALQEENANLKADLQEIQSQLSEQQSRITQLEETLQHLAQYPQGAFQNNKVNNLQGALLYQNQPNPFDDVTHIGYSVPTTANVAELVIYESGSGKIAKRLPIGTRGEGEIVVSGHDLESGTYHYTLVVDGQTVESKSMIVVK